MEPDYLNQNQEPSPLEEAEQLVETFVDEETAAAIMASIGGAIIGTMLQSVNRDFGIAITSASIAFGINSALQGLAVGLTKDQSQSVTSAGSMLMSPLMKEDSNAINTGVNTCNMLMRAV